MISDISLISFSVQLIISICNVLNVFEEYAKYVHVPGVKNKGVIVHLHLT